MSAAAVLLEEFGVAYEKNVVSAHRTPHWLAEYAGAAQGRGLQVIIAGAGGAAHLPGMAAAFTTLPVLGVPVESRALKGLDSLLSIAQMPAGVPVGTLAIGEPGAKNAALLAVSILALHDEALRGEVGEAYRAAQTAKVRAAETACRQSMSDRNRSFPAAIVGCLGGGQLGRMFALAARRMGYRVHTVDPTPDSPTGQISDREYNAPFDDIATLIEFASGVDVVTYEFENIPVEALDALAPHAMLRPGRNVLYIAQNRRREKEFLQASGFPVAPFRVVQSEDELRTGGGATWAAPAC